MLPTFASTSRNPARFGSIQLVSRAAAQLPRRRPTPALPPSSRPALARRSPGRTAPENPYNIEAMKTDLHPNYVTTTVHCSCGSSFETRSTKADLHVELCNECHPFYTGKQKLVDTGGRVERFERRYGARKSKKA